MSNTINVTIIGGGMITYDVLLPSMYHLQRSGTVGEIAVVALNTPPLKALADSEEFAQAFPGQSFTPYPSLSEPPDKVYPELFKEVIAGMPPHQIVVVALPDDMHYKAVMAALEANQHVLCVKPLVLKQDESAEIEQFARERGLFVGIEYHKRFDRRSLITRRSYRLGHFGEFAAGEAKLIEPYFYRHSNFQNWFTCDRTDPFTYVGCHYVDLVYFITGLRPTEVSVVGVKGRFPNGKEGYMWANGRIRFENGAILNVTNGLGYPDEGSGSNDQCLTMFCEGDDKTGMIKHDDQFRGVTHCYLEGLGLGGTKHNFVNPDFFKFTPWEGNGYQPVGYGFDSVAANIRTAHRIAGLTNDLSETEALSKRQELIREVDDNGIIATPANSYANTLVMEAARVSILKDGAPVKIIYGERPHIER
jgi:D-galacturonate reductase